MFCLSSPQQEAGGKYRGIKLRELIVKQDAWCQSLVIALSVSLILLFGIFGGNEAANFIYFQF